ncbi:hypothetical protein [Tortoise microvirus 74]|nr:hypothetical protein [Tortoise microvirus 74]
MSVKLRHLAKWAHLPAGEVIPLAGKKRIVTLEFNVDFPTRFDVLENGKSTLLRAVEPRECPLKVSFAVEGDCAIVADTEGDVWWATDDGEVLSYEVETESFTKLQQRMEMTPEMELTIYKAQLRAEQRAREVAELLLAKKQREEAEAANADPETGEVNDKNGAGLGQAAADGTSEAGSSAAPKP